MLGMPMKKKKKKKKITSMWCKNSISNPSWIFPPLEGYEVYKCLWSTRN